MCHLQSTQQESTYTLPVAPSRHTVCLSCPAGAFLALAVLFFKDAGGVEDAPHSSSMVANALQQLQTNRGLRAILLIVGILLIIYGEMYHISHVTCGEGGTQRMATACGPIWSLRWKLWGPEFSRHL